ncbi:MAG: flagellar hook-basal body complex protein FliE [Leptolyngbya sp. PLA1]|nr:flagellar hook-basal body complex protein FliE [Leptolyngbya sp. PLA1]
MTDPVGLISASGGAHDPRRAIRTPEAQDPSAPSFKDALLANLNEANRLQQEATRAVEDLQTGQRQDVENVLLATTKADNAFKMLQALRNRMMEAYDEIKQMRT